MTDLPDVALGVKVFSRTGKLETLLESVPSEVVSTVYIADDGDPSEAKDALYTREFPFDLKVLDLDYDAGLGAGRTAIVETLSEPYLLITDTDHRIPSTVGTLVEQLEAAPELGGVAGLLLEDGRIHGTCHDLFEEGDNLIRDVRGGKPVRRVAGSPFVPFEFVPNVAAFRRACLEEQSWDPEYVIGKEHLDFYVAHKHHTDWSFGVNPTVVFDHNPRGDADYMSNRTSYPKLTQSHEYFMEKWGYRQIIHGQTDWVDPSTPLRGRSFVAQLLFKLVLLRLPPRAQSFVMAARQRLRRFRGKPPL